MQVLMMCQDELQQWNFEILDINKLMILKAISIVS